MADNLFVVLMILLMITIAVFICFDMQSVFGAKELSATGQGDHASNLVRNQSMPALSPTEAHHEAESVAMEDAKANSDVDIFAPKFEPVERVLAPTTADEDLPNELQKLRNANFEIQPLRPEDKDQTAQVVQAS